MEDEPLARFKPEKAISTFTASSFEALKDRFKKSNEKEKRHVRQGAQRASKFQLLCIDTWRSTCNNFCHAS